MSGFDFGLQFLDADRMTYWGQRRDASFWTENASLEWKETEAPFHTVATAYAARELAAYCWTPPKQPILMSPVIRHPTACRWGASIARAGRAK